MSSDASRREISSELHISHNQAFCRSLAKGYLVKENSLLNLWALATGSHARNSKELFPVLVGTARLELARCEVRAEVQIIPYEGALVPATHTGLRSQVERRAAPVKQTSRLL